MNYLYKEMTLRKKTKITFNYYGKNIKNLIPMVTNTVNFAYIIEGINKS